MFLQWGLRARISSRCAHGTGRPGLARGLSPLPTQLQQHPENAMAVLGLLRQSEKHSWQCSLSYLFIFQNKNNKHMTMISREHLGSLPPSHSFQQFLSHYHSWMCTWLFSLINRKELEQRQVHSVILVSLAQCTLRSRWSINIHFYELNWIVTNSDKESKRRPTASGLKRWYMGRNVSQVLGSKRFIQKLIL